MDIRFYTLITVLNFISVEGRLIHKNKTKVLEVIQTENPNPKIRLSRDIHDQFLTGFSYEEPSDEFLDSYNRRYKMFSDFVRRARELNETDRRKHPLVKVMFPSYRIDNDHLMKSADIDYDIEWGPRSSLLLHHKSPGDHIKVLVKKPIPKFSDIDYEDDFQVNLNKARSAFIDSGDHEDEDFNLDDYDFDVNHDEFLSGRKPLEPRISFKHIENILAMRPSFKIQSKIINPKDHRAIKREEPDAMFSKEFDYYDDVSTTTDSNKENQDSGSEYSDEGDSKEEKKPQLRTIRSWDVGKYINKVDDKAARVMKRFLNILPLLPQIPSEIPNHRKRS